MNSDESFDCLTYEDPILLAGRELASFIGAVTELFGPEQARLSADDWLEESELMDSASAPRSTIRDWRAVTIAASARLANRLTLARGRRVSLGSLCAAPTEIKVSPVPSSDFSLTCFCCDRL